MTQSNKVNRQFALAERPKGEPDENTLRLEAVDIPEPAKDQMLLRNEYLSLDPYMRGRMSDKPSYAAPVEHGDVMVGGTVSQVVTSDVDGFTEGDWGVASGGWQDYALSDGKGVTNMGKNPGESVMGTGGSWDAALSVSPVGRRSADTWLKLWGSTLASTIT